MSATLRRPGRLIAAVVVAAAVGLSGTAPAAAATPSTYDDGLFGVPDIYGSTYRHSLALLALSTVDAPSAAQVASVDRGVRWLREQQCADGGWMGYRADITKPCTPDPKLFTSEDTNATAIAVQALAALGAHPVRDPRPYFWAAQSADGGFEFQQGFGSDPNSTALVVEAIVALGEDPLAAAWQRSGKSPLDALLSFQLGCTTTDPADRGSLTTPFANGAPNLLASVQGGPALALQALPVASTPTPAATSPAPDCTSSSPPATTPAAASGFLATWLAGRLTDGVIASSGQPDWASTANAAQSIAASRTNRSALDAIVAALSARVTEATAGSDSSRQVGSLANVALAAIAGGANPRSFGGVDLLAQVLARQITVAAAPSPSATPNPKPTATASPAASGATSTPSVAPTLVATGGPAGELLPWGVVAVLAGGLALIAARLRVPYRGRHAA